VFGHDLDNTRDSSHEGAPTPDNVACLRRLWEFTGPATTSTPAVADGVVYLPGWDGKLYARRLDDGTEVWTATLPALIDSSPAVSDTHVFVADDKGSVHAVDRTTHAVSWSMRVDPHPETHLWSSPVLVPEENLLIIGVASSEEAVNAGSWSFRGSVVGLDATTGSIRFQVYTTTGDASSGAGIGVWSTAAVDTTRGLAFLGTGNNYTQPTGPYADAMLAIDYREGEIAWARQFTADDVFVVGNPTGPDFDIGSSANLFRANDKDLLGIGIKSGLYYALDRDTGGEQWMATVSAGSVLGGVISASAYADGKIFVASNERFMGQSVVAALNAASGVEQWRQIVPTDTYSGVSHANGVVYVGTNGGTLHAFDASNGTPLFSDTLPDSIAGGPVVVDGVLLVPWGYQWTLRGGQPGSGGLIAYGL
jgi:polyvinyl alcohol dehydrogenase (cytochrome)